MTRYIVTMVMLAFAVASREAEQITAVQKVIQMMTDMLATAKAAMHDEQTSYAAFEMSCSNDQSQLSASIATASETIESVSAQIGSLTAEVETLGTEIATLSQNLEVFEADKKKTLAERAKDNEAFEAQSKDYAESIDALERAIVVLQKQNYDRTGASSALLQLSQNADLPQHAKEMITGFMDLMNDDAAESKAPEANAYEFQSGSVIELLQKLKSEFTEKLSQAEKEEMNSAHAANMVVQDLENSIDAAKSDSANKVALKQEKAHSAAVYKKQLTEVTADKKTDEDLLAERKAECAEKGLSYKEKQVLRKEEIEALEKAIEILKKASLEGVVFLQAAKKAVALAQVKRGPALMQFLAGVHADDEPQDKAMKARKYLETQAGKLHSKNLNLILQKFDAAPSTALIDATEDPFAKVKRMIEDMIEKLLAETNTEANKKGFCDKEVGKSKITRTRLTEEIDILRAGISEGTSTIALLTEDIATLDKEIAELAASMAEATDLRKKEKAHNEATVEDAKAGAKAVQAATAVLKDFYKKAGTATGFLQMDSKSKQPVKMDSPEWNAMANPGMTVDKGHRKGMQTFGETYKGQQAEAGGVLAMMEVILSDLKVLKTETEAAESTAAKAYGRFMAESKTAKAEKAKSVEMKGADKMSAEEQKQHDTADLKSTEDQLLAAERYYSTLKPQCVDDGVSYEARVAARAEEIQSLKEALAILNGESI